MDNTKPDKERVAQALAAAFGVPAQSSNIRLEDMAWARVQVFESANQPLVSVFGADGAWTLTVEFAQDGTGDIETYGAGLVLQPSVIEAIAMADTSLDGFLIGGLDMFCLNPDYDEVDRKLARTLKRKIEALRGKTSGAQAQA